MSLNQTLRYRLISREWNPLRVSLALTKASCGGRKAARTRSKVKVERFQSLSPPVFSQSGGIPRRTRDPRKSENTPKCLVEPRLVSGAPSFLPPGEMMIARPPLSTRGGLSPSPRDPRRFLSTPLVTAATIDSCTFLFRPLGIPMRIAPNSPMSLDTIFRVEKRKGVTRVIAFVVSFFFFFFYYYDLSIRSPIYF